MLRPDNPLLPNYKWVPIGYHGRSSSIVVSGHAGAAAARPDQGARRGRAEFGPSRRLDYEAELGFVIGPGNALGKPIADRERARPRVRRRAAQRLVGARHPGLGIPAARAVPRQELRHHASRPGSSRCEALEPYRCPAFPRAAGDPQPLPYLWDDADQRAGGFAIEVEMHLRTREDEGAGAPVARAASATRTGRWRSSSRTTRPTAATCARATCSARARISGATPDSFGSMMELTQGGKTSARAARRRDARLPARTATK